MNPLKPCPFCNGKNLTIEVDEDCVAVACDCGAYGPLVRIVKDSYTNQPLEELAIDSAVSAWNRRLGGAA